MEQCHCQDQQKAVCENNSVENLWR